MPVWVGVPGSIRLRSLEPIAARIGVVPPLSVASMGHTLRLPSHSDAPAFQQKVTVLAAEAKADFARFRSYTFDNVPASVQA
jgi:hypothetical protein